MASAPLPGPEQDDGDQPPLQPGVPSLDPHVPLSDVTAFAEEMNAASADWQLIAYGGALHGFTHADAAPAAVPGVAYHPLADTRSFTAVRAFLADVFASGERQHYDTPD